MDPLLAKDQEFFDALVAADHERLDDLLAADFILVGIGDGAMVGKADLLAAVTSGAVRFPAVRAFPDEAVVRVVGPVGVVVGRTSMSFTHANGTVFTSGSRYTHVYAQDPRVGWRMISAQGTEIR